MTFCTYENQSAYGIESRNRHSHTHTCTLVVVVFITYLTSFTAYKLSHNSLSRCHGIFVKVRAFQRYELQGCTMNTASIAGVVGSSCYILTPALEDSSGFAGQDFSAFMEPEHSSRGHRSRHWSLC